MTESYRGPGSSPEVVEATEEQLSEKFNEVLDKVNKIEIEGGKETNDPTEFEKRIYLDKIRFLLDLYSIEPGNISLQAIEVSLLDQNQDEFKVAKHAQDLITCIIFLELAKKEYSNAMHMLEAVEETGLSGRNNVLMGVYKASVYLRIPEEYKTSCRSLALSSYLSAGFDQERFNAIEGSWEDLTRRPDSLRANTLKRIKTSVVAAYKYCSKKIGDELLTEVQRFDRSFEISPTPLEDTVQKKPVVGRPSSLRKMDPAELMDEYNKYIGLTDPKSNSLRAQIVPLLEGYTEDPKVALFLIKNRIKNLSSMKGNEDRRKRVYKIVGDLERIIDQNLSEPTLNQLAIRLYRGIVPIVRYMKLSIKLREDLIAVQRKKNIPSIKVRSTPLVPKNFLREKRENQAPVEVKFDPKKVLKLAEQILGYVERITKDRPKNWQEEASASLIRAKDYADNVSEYLAEEKLKGKTPDSTVELNILVLEKQINDFRTLIYRNQGIRRRKIHSKEPKILNEDPHSSDIIEIRRLIDVGHTVLARQRLVDILREGTESKDILEISFNFAIKDLELTAAENILFMLRPHISNKSFKERLGHIKKLEGDVSRKGGFRFGGGTVWGNFGTREPIDRTAYEVTEGEYKKSHRQDKKPGEQT